MKKEMFILMILFLLPTILAVNIELSKTSYQPQETLQSKITGNFIDTITIGNVFLYKEGVPRTMPAISDLTKYSNTYYLYMILPNQEGNFSLKIENARYTEAGVEKTNAIIKEFIVERTNESALQISPGFIKTTTDFQIKIKAINENQDISASFNEQTQDFSLIEDTEKTVSFSISDIAAGKHDLTINDYTIPVFIIEKIIMNETNGIINETNETDLNQTTNETKITIEELENKTEEEIKALHCGDFGEKCEENEVCDGETKESLEGPCCIGTCKEKKQRSYSWLGWILVLLVLAVVAYFMFKVKRKKPPSSDEILKKREEKFGERMKGEEVSGSLGRI